MNFAAHCLTDGLWGAKTLVCATGPHTSPIIYNSVPLTRPAGNLIHRYADARKLRARMITCCPLSHPTRLTSQSPLLPFFTRSQCHKTIPGAARRRPTPTHAQVGAIGGLRELAPAGGGAQPSGGVLGRHASRAAYCKLARVVTCDQNLWTCPLECVTVVGGVRGAGCDRRIDCLLRYTHLHGFERGMSEWTIVCASGCLVSSRTRRS